jgi:hypothetical protein
MSKETKTARKKITEQVLIERLFLDEEWLDPDNADIRFDERLPASIRRQKSSTVIREIEQYVDRLVDHGCHRGVIYWCLERLTPEEEQFRFKGASTPVPEENERPGVRPIPGRTLATREKLSPLISGLRSVSGMVQRYKRELLFTADAFEREIPLPEGLLTEGPSDPADAMLLLQSCLKWARKLAENWAAPQLTTIMRSKGILYLVAYASMRSTSDQGKRGRASRRKAEARPDSTMVLRRADARVITHLVDTCSGIAIHEDDLISKLRGFQSDHPLLYARLLHLMEHLHTAALS